MNIRLIITAVLGISMLVPVSARELEAGTSTAVFGKRYGTAELAEALQEGINYIEVAVNQSYRGVPADEVEDRMRSVAESIDSSGIKVWSVHLPFSRKLDISVTDDSLRSENLTFLKRMIRLCSELYRPERFVLHPSSEPIDDSVREERIENSIASIRELKKAADETGIMLCIENLPRTCLGNTPEELVRIVDSVPDTGICFDTSHYTEGTVEHFMEVAGKRIKTVHISDFDFENECHWLPFEGNVDWKGFIACMCGAVGYDGVMMYEVKSHKDKSAVSMRELAESFSRMSEGAAEIKTVIK